jgi:pimeloyl-ACP methyl ester carboxylesterase
MDLVVDGRRAYAATGGRPFDAQKPVTVFIHGAGQDHTNWQLPARWCAWHGQAVLAVDLPGHGRSEGPALATVPELAAWIGRLLTAAGADHATLVGHSLGGAIALEAAAGLADRARGLIVLGAAAALPVNAELLRAARDTPAVAHRLITAWALGADAKRGGNAVPGLWLSNASLALLARNRPGVLAADFEACNRWTSGMQAAARVRCPTLIVIGANDVMTPPRAGHQLAQAIAGAKTVTIANCGHTLMAEAPDAVLDALIAFFAPRRAASAA